VRLLEDVERAAQQLGIEPPEGTKRARARLEQAAAAEAGDTFVMISAEQFSAVNDYLAERSATPVVAMRLWARIIGHLDRQTGEILLSRSELAKLVGTRPDEISRIMGELAEINAVFRHREPANGPVTYLLNPRVGTHLPGPARKLAQRDAPKLVFVRPD
jgi:hypothetical protein